MRLEAEGTSVDQAPDVLESFYAGTAWTIRPTEQPFEFRYAALGDEAMTLRTSSMSGTNSGDIPPGDDYIIQWIVAGRGIVDVGRDNVQLALGTPMLFPSYRPFVFWFGDYDQKLVHLGREHVARVATERGLQDAQSARFDHLAIPDPRAVAKWHSTISGISAAVHTGRVTPLLWNGLSRQAASAFLDLYPPAGTSMPAVLLKPQKAHLRIAVEFIHNNAHLPIGPIEVAEAAHLSVRGLQVAFRRLFDASPLEYIRDVRLDRVRVELRLSDPATTRVGDVARDWGFAHLGRFASVYEQRFGELPHHTLHS